MGVPKLPERLGLIRLSFLSIDLLEIDVASFSIGSVVVKSQRIFSRRIMPAAPNHVDPVIFGACVFRVRPALMAHPTQPQGSIVTQKIFFGKSSAQQCYGALQE
jgi:hypothetical protein